MSDVMFLLAAREGDTLSYIEASEELESHD